jgi:hypothetical protein
MIKRTDEFAQGYNASLNHLPNKISVIRTNSDKELGKKQEGSP